MSNVTFKDNSGEYLAILQNRLGIISEAIGMQMERHGKENLNTFEHHGKTGYVDTGRAKNSITHTHQKDENGITIFTGSNVEYFVWLEIGTGIYASDGKGRKTPWLYVDSKGESHWTSGLLPSHSLQRAITEHVDEYKQILIDGLKQPVNI